MKTQSECSDNVKFNSKFDFAAKEEEGESRCRIERREHPIGRIERLVGVEEVTFSVRQNSL